MTAPPLFQDSERPNWVNKFSKAKWFYIPLVFVGLFFGLSTLKEKYMAKNQFYGTWQNTDTTASLKYINFEVANTFKINGTHNIDKIANGQYSFTKDLITLKAYTKEYQDFLKNDKTNEMLRPDTTKMVTLIKGKYQVNEKQLTIQHDTTKIVLNRVR